MTFHECSEAPIIRSAPASSTVERGRRGRRLRWRRRSRRRRGRQWGGTASSSQTVTPCVTWYVRDGMVDTPRTVCYVIDDGYMTRFPKLTLRWTEKARVNLYDCSPSVSFLRQSYQNYLLFTRESPIRLTLLGALSFPVALYCRRVRVYSLLLCRQNTVNGKPFRLVKTR